MSTEDDDDRESMDDAVERARASGGRDVFGLLDEPDDAFSGAEPDVRRLGPGESTGPDWSKAKTLPRDPSKPNEIELLAGGRRAMELPELDLTEKPSLDSADSTQPLASTAKPVGLQTDSETVKAPPLPAPKAKPDDEFTSKIQGIMSRRYSPSPGLSDADIAAAKKERAKGVARNDFTRAIQAWLLRKPFNPTDPEDVGADLERRREKEQAGFERERSNDLSATAALAKALRGEKAGTKYDDPYHTALGEQARSLVEERNRKAADTEAVKQREASELEALRREAARQLPGVDVTGLGAIDLRGLVHAKDAKERARILAAAKAQEKAEGRPLAPSALEEIADADVAKKQVAGLEKTFNELGMGSPSAKASAFVTNLLGLQFTDAAKFDAESRRVQQAAGKILEGGKLAAGDETKYRNMLLKPGDSPDVVAVKTAGMLDFLEDVKAGRIKVYRAGGYKVPAELDSPSPGGGKIRVRRKADGTTGSISPQFFDPAKYERIE